MKINWNHRSLKSSDLCWREAEDEMLIFRISLATIYVYCYALRCFKINSISALFFHTKFSELEKNQVHTFFASQSRLGKAIFLHLERKSLFMCIGVEAARQFSAALHDVPSTTRINRPQCDAICRRWIKISFQKKMCISTQQSRFEAPEETMHRGNCRKKGNRSGCEARMLNHGKVYKNKKASSPLLRHLHLV